MSNVDLSSILINETWKPINGSFIKEDWNRIKTALQSFIIDKESHLIKSNSRDTEWSELEKYKSITRDIECFLLGDDHDGFGYRHF